MNTIEQRYKEWRAFLKRCEENGFAVENRSRTLSMKAEFYRYNQWTVEISIPDHGNPDVVRVEVYFDHEWNDHRNRSLCFPWDEMGKALEKAMAWRSALKGDLLSEALESATP